MNENDTSSTTLSNLPTAPAFEWVIKLPRKSITVPTQLLVNLVHLQKYDPEVVNNFVKALSSPGNLSDVIAKIAEALREILRARREEQLDSTTIKLPSKLSEAQREMERIQAEIQQEIAVAFASYLNLDQSIALEPVAVKLDHFKEVGKLEIRPQDYLEAINALL